MNPNPCEDHKYIDQIYRCANQQPETAICLPTPQTVSYFRQFFSFCTYLYSTCSSNNLPMFLVESITKSTTFKWELILRQYY